MKMSIGKTLVAALLIFPVTVSAVCNYMVEYQITTGGPSGTYYQIGKNLAKYVAPDACINLEVVNSKGSMDNLVKLNSPRYPKMKFAIVQHDVFQELKRLAVNGNRKAARLVKRLRVVKALYNEEIHVITNKNSSINNLEDLRGKKISMGKLGSGTAMTGNLLYAELFKQELSSSQVKFEKFSDALNSLEQREVDAIIKVAGQPVLALSKFEASAKDFIKLVEFGERSGNQNNTSYYATEIKKSNYRWLENDVKALSTKAYLVTFNYQGNARGHIQKFAKSLNNKMRELQNQATKDLNTPHLKWREVPVACDTPLPGGWKYYGAASAACVPSPNQGSQGNCTPMQRALGQCQ